MPYTTVYPFSDFTSLFEISFAIHILYSLIPQIQIAFIARAQLIIKSMDKSFQFFKDRLEEVKKERQLKEKEYDKLGGVNQNWNSLPESEKEKIRVSRKDFFNRERDIDSVIRALEFHRNGYESSVQTINKIRIDLSKEFIPISLTVSLLSICFIIYAGFQPERGLPLIGMIPLILVSLLTMPFMLYLTYRRSKHEINRVNFSAFSMFEAVGLYWNGKVDEIKYVEYDFIAKR